jgi:hypothetical protein
MYLLQRVYLFIYLFAIGEELEIPSRENTIQASFGDKLDAWD